MTPRRIVDLCEDAVETWLKGPSDATIVFHATAFKDAVLFRDYMESKHDAVNIFIICDGFVYGTEIKHMRDKKELL